MIPESHKIIAGRLYQHIEEEYGLRLNKKKLLWGSIAPDFLPKYKFIGHYKKESIGYISREIFKMTLFLSAIGPEQELNPIVLDRISKKIGIISHYLTDYTTHPHARRLRCTSRANAKAHIKYELELNDFLRSYEIEDLGKNLADTDFYEGSLLGFRPYIVDKIDETVDQYLERDIAFSHDIEFALALNTRMLSTMFETEKVSIASPKLQTV